jgi:hypothetical protein
MKRTSKSSVAVGNDVAVVLKQNLKVSAEAVRFLSAREEAYYDSYRTLLREIRRKKIYSSKTTHTEISAGVLRAAKSLHLL